MLRKLIIRNYTKADGSEISSLPLSYRIYGPPLGKAPLVLVNHALTGNSLVSGENGWWHQLIGFGKTIDTHRFSVLCFDIPGNGHNGFLIKDYEGVSCKDVALWFLEGIQQLGISRIFVGIGGSLGGSILWNMAVINPELFEYVIPIATDWKTINWVLAQCRVQKEILEKSQDPVHDARLHAMTLYRSPESLQRKFEKSKNQNQIFQVENWLLHHGQKLKERFHLLSYKLMNHLLTTVDITDFYKKASEIKGKILLIGITSDGFFLNQEIKKTYRLLHSLKEDVFYAEIDSIDGHDAFLTAYEELDKILKGIFQIKIEKQKRKKYEYAIVE